MKKKLLFVAILCVMTLGVSAQGKFTVWYGANISSLSTDGESPDSELKALNIGVDYSAPINDLFEWTAGASYLTKGCKDWDPSFVQIDANAGWNFFKNDNVKLGLLTGPYADILVGKDDMEDTESFTFGWQAGVKACYKAFSLKVGYELGLSDVFKDGKSKANGVYFRVGYSF